MKTEKLVQLHLVSQFHIEPTPDKSVLGRFDKALRAVGATGSIAVRSRMITAVAATKFKTISGLPVTLLGLHGKDDLLVLGPPWALERVAAGEWPDPPKALGRADMLRNAQSVTELEIQCLSQLSEILRHANHLEDLGAATGTPKQAAARELLTALFRTSADRIAAFFEKEEPNHFAQLQIAEARTVLSSIQADIASGTDNYPIWWEAWGDADYSGGDDVCITASGRHVSAYPTVSANPQQRRKPRTNDLRLFLDAFVTGRGDR